MMFLLLGCGSDSTPKGAATAKKEQPAKSPGDKGTRTITSLLSDKEGNAPQLQVLDKLPVDLTPEEIEARRKAAEQTMLDPKYELFRGLTMEQVEAKREAARRAMDSKKFETFPGLTQEQYNAKLMEAQKRPAPAKILLGLTEEQVKAKAAEAKQAQDAKGQRPEQVFPQK
jgi:hypothetical protein